MLSSLFCDLITHESQQAHGLSHRGAHTGHVSTHAEPNDGQELSAIPEGAESAGVFRRLWQRGAVRRDAVGPKLRVPTTRRHISDNSQQVSHRLWRWTLRGSVVPAWWAFCSPNQKTPHKVLRRAPSTAHAHESYASIVTLRPAGLGLPKPRCQQVILPQGRIDISPFHLRGVHLSAVTTTG
jgi:hypothetical protein